MIRRCTSSSRCSVPSPVTSDRCASGFRSRGRRRFCGGKRKWWEMIKREMSFKSNVLSCAPFNVIVTVRRSGNAWKGILKAGPKALTCYLRDVSCRFPSFSGTGRPGWGRKNCRKSRKGFFPYRSAWWWEWTRRSRPTKDSRCSETFESSRKRLGPVRNSSRRYFWISKVSLAGCLSANFWLKMNRISVG